MVSKSLTAQVDQSRQKFGQLYLATRLNLRSLKTQARVCVAKVDLAGSERVIKTAVAGTHLVEAAATAGAGQPKWAPGRRASLP